MDRFTQFEKKTVSELRPITEEEIKYYKRYKVLTLPVLNKSTREVTRVIVTISNKDKQNGSPTLGDMIARDPEDIRSMWLVSKEEFNKEYKYINKEDVTIIKAEDYLKDKAHYDLLLSYGDEIYISDGAPVYELSQYLKLKSIWKADIT